MRQFFNGFARAAFLLLFVLSVGICHADEVIDRAKYLMAQGKPAEAFALLEPLESQRAGDIEFDYLLGTAALDSGKLDRATIALERVLVVNPNLAGARLDLARAHFAMGSDDLAKAEFETVLTEAPPDNVKIIVGQYLAAIEARQKKNQPALVGYVEAGGGYDSNVTTVGNGFSGGVLQAYGIPGVQPTGNSIPRNAAFSQVAIGADYTQPIELQSRLGAGIYVGGDVKERHYYHNSNDFDYLQYDGRAGLSVALEADLFRVGLQGSSYSQVGATPSSADGTRINNDRNSFGYTAEWRHALAPGRQLSLFMQINQQRFTTNPGQNINQNLYGGQFMNVWDAKGKPLLMLVAYQSRDRAIGPSNLAGTTDVSKTLTGLRAFGQYSLQEQLDIFMSIGFTQRQDNSQFSRSLLINYGKDRTFDANLGVNWRFMRGWSLRGQLSAFDNRSNLSLYEYRRTESSIFLRVDFK